MLVKALMIPEPGFPMMVQFNPKELSLSKSVNWSPQQSPSSDTPEQQFTSGQGRTLSFELFFDRYEMNLPVLMDVMLIEKMTKVVDELHRPPVVRFIWGMFMFKGVFKQMQTRYTMFLNIGAPCRATVSCVLQEYESLEEQSSGTRLQSPDHAKMRLVKRGETLHSIAGTEYDNVAEWRRIADANNITDPMNLEPGMELLVPPILPSSM
jgi:nucleoid-associated protein YgaU